VLLFVCSRRQGQNFSSSCLMPQRRSRRQIIPADVNVVKWLTGHAVLPYCSVMYRSWAVVKTSSVLHQNCKCQWL
jgi:hypothetical protein